MTQYGQNNSAFFIEERQDKIHALKLAGKDDKVMSGRDTRPLMSWKSLPVPCSVQINTSFLQQLRISLPKPDVQQDQDDIKGLTMTLFDSNSYKQSKTITENFFKKEITDQERVQINERVSLQQRQFANHESRQKIRMYNAIREVFDYLSDEEISDVLKECENNEEKAICRLAEPGTLAQLRKTIALRYSSIKEETSSDVPLIKSEQTLPKQAATKNRQPRIRLDLDVALKQITDTKSKKAFEGWSEARIRSFKMIEKNPNNYYYRFNEPGEEQKRGPWAEDEKKLFIDRLKVMGTGQWGLFSKGIPGRVGYQCANFYRFLIETKQLKDGQYMIAPNGKPLYMFEKELQDGTIEKRLRTDSKSLSQSCSSAIHAADPSNVALTDGKLNKPTKRKISNRKGTSAKKARRRHRLTMPKDSSSDSEIESYDNDASGNFVPRNYYRTRADKVQSEKHKQAERLTTKEGRAAIQDVASADGDECLLPGFIDPITLDQVKKPAISKYGHIMGYETWMRCISNWQGGSTKNVCPITKQKLTKRDLVLLTSENLHLYKNEISKL